MIFTKFIVHANTKNQPDLEEPDEDKKTSSKKEKIKEKKKTK